MRAATLSFGIALILALMLPDTAPSQSAGSTFMQNWAGSNARTVTNVPVDTGKAMKAMNVSNTIRTPGQQKTFNVGNIFPKVKLPTWPPTVAKTPVLSQKNNPYQPNQIVGQTPFAQTPKK